MDSDEYQLTIKSANQKVDDYTLNCRSHWNVKRLKQHISETHVNKPTIGDQRLIYAGNLLKDHQNLKQIFFRDSLCTELTNSNKTDFTIHLVCAQHKIVESAAGSSNASRNKTAPVDSPIPTSVASPIPTDSSLPVTTNNGATLTSASTNQSNNIQNRNTVQPSLPLNNAASQHAEMIQSIMQSEPMRQQMATFQQLARMFAEQLANSIDNNISLRNLPTSSAQINGSTSANFASSFPITNVQTIPTSPLTNNTNNIATTQLLFAANRQQAQSVQTDPNEHNNHPVEDNQANVVGAGANVANVPGGAQFGFAGQIQGQAPVVEQQAAVRPDQGMPAMQHDVIDWVYYSVRAALLMAALYIHASMFRLLFIVGLLAIAYFFNRRSARRNNVAMNRQEAPNPVVREVNIADFNNVQPGNIDQRQRPPGRAAGQVADNNAGAEQRAEVDGEAIPNAQEERVPGRLPILKFCYLVLTDFLASLVPE